MSYVIQSHLICKMWHEHIMKTHNACDISHDSRFLALISTILIADGILCMKTVYQYKSRLSAFLMLGYCLTERIDKRITMESCLS